MNDYSELRAKRFEEKVVKTETCWFWRGSLATNGYGRVWDGKKQRPAHRVAWEMHHKRPFPEGMFACHTCDVRSCVNPEHIFVGTTSDNQQDSVAKGRARNAAIQRTHCPKGHPYDEANTWQRDNGWRQCRECNRQRCRDRRKADAK